MFARYAVPLNRCVTSECIFGPILVTTGALNRLASNYFSKGMSRFLRLFERLILVQ